MGAEFVGTAMLVSAGIGAAVFAGKDIGTLGIALAFGFALLALVYAVGPVSGAHLNPAVTLSFVLSGRMKVGIGIQYWLAQLLGGILGAAVIVVVRSQVNGVSQQLYGNNGFGELSQTNTEIGGAFFVEMLATFLFVFVVLAVTSRVANSAFVGLTVGAAFTVSYLMTIPISGGGVNPARSLGPAIFAGGEALSQVWVFLVAPLLGALLAVLVHALVTTERQAAADAAAVAATPVAKSVKPSGKRPRNKRPARR
ncbi:MAG: aquaporin [Streptosporangiales bacterium]|nr:aquaporin [Streptosporangiales bacterium]